jgi:alkaline phosphatase
LRAVVATFVLAVVATLVVVWLIGGFRSPAAATGVVDGSRPTSPEVAPSTSAAATPAPSATAAPSASRVPSDEPSAAAPDPILIGAGDIATCAGNDDEQTARLVDDNEGIVFTLGDNAYDNGSPADYRECYDPAWGRVKDRTELPVPGNHDYNTANAAGYRDYFGRRATPDGDTWYSRDIGEWHVIVLDANCDDVTGGCGRGSPQLRWLRQDLRDSEARCVLAMWHQPRFSSGGEHGNDPTVSPFWEALYGAGADLVLNGHDHDYERFAPQDPDGRLDRERGITEIVVGTGGGEMRALGATQPNSLVRKGRLLGVIQVTLHADGWSTRFLSTDGSFEDESAGTCH